MKPSSFEKPEQKPIKETAEKVMPVSAKFLKSLYSSSGFLRALKTTIKEIDKREGWEVGFGILKDLRTNKVLISDPIKGEEQTRIRFSVEMYTFKQHQQFKFKDIAPDIVPIVPGEEFVEFGSLHFHPCFFEDMPIIPSGITGDLKTSSQIRLSNRAKFKYDIIPIEMIAEQTWDKEVVVLVYQEPLNFSLLEVPTAFKALDLSLGKANSQEEVLELLRAEKYRAEILRTKELKFTPDDLQKLSSFAYTPRKIERPDL